LGVTPALLNRTAPSRLAGLLPLVACALAAFACAPPAPETRNEENTPSAVSSIEQGRLLYLRKCDQCHALPAVQDHSPEKWDDILNKMKVQAALTPREDYLVRAWVVTSSQWMRDSLSIR
jgi:hypothetical protein